MKKRGYTIEDLEELLDNLQYEIWLKDKTGKHIYINKLGAEKVGLDKCDIIGKTDHEIRPSYIADKCMETDMDLITGKIDRYSQEEGVGHLNDVSYHVNKFILKRENNLILGGIAEEISLDKSIQTATEYIMSNDLSTIKIKKEYKKFLKDKLKALNSILNSINIDIFLYGTDEEKFTLYMSANDENCVFDIKHKVESKGDLEEYISNIFNKEINDGSVSENISKVYEINIANEMFALVSIRYEDLTSIKYRDDVSIGEILRKISILIFQLENECKLLDSGNEKKEIEDAIDFENIKYDFLANISHEFRTPINIILSVVQILKLRKGEINKNITESKYTEYLNILGQNSYRLLRLVNNIVDTAKVGSNFYELNLYNYNIVKIIEDITMSTVNYVEEKKRSIIFDTDEEEVILACDPDKIERVVLNLISNAIKFSVPNSDINIIIKTDRIKKKVYVSVMNKGDLISEKDACKIFGQFIQGEKLFRRRTEGSGIGLFLSKYFVEMHNGDIWVNIENKKFTEFTFSLPIVVIDDSDKDDYNRDGVSMSNMIERCNIEFSDIYK